MKNFTQKLFLVLLCAVTIVGQQDLNAQNIGVNAIGAIPNASAGLDVDFTNKGMLIPRVALSSTASNLPVGGGVATSLLVYNTATVADVTPGFYYWGGASWIRFFTGNPLVDNGLYFNAGANRVRLGGPLVENSTVTQGGFQMNFNLNGTGDFNVQDAGVTHFQVRDNGLSYFGDDTYWNDGNVTGTTLGRFYDSANDGVFEVYENGAVQHRIHGAGTTVFNEQGDAYDFRVETDARTNMFFIDASTNRIGINTGLPASPLQFISTGENVWLMQWDNNSTVGAAARFQNSLAANGNRALMGTTNYNGSVNVASAVIGISLNNTTIGSGGIGVFGSANNESGNAVEGSLFFTGGYAGWGGYFNADVNTTGGYFTISDERFKRDIEPISEAVDIVNKLNPVSYYYDTEKYPEVGLDEDRLSHGFIAQELEQVMPEMIKDKIVVLNSKVEKTASMQSPERKTGEFKVVNYTLLIPILTQAIKEQQDMIEAQNKRIEELEKITKELQE